MATMPTLARPVQRETLPNGLTVLLREDHAAPVAAFYVFYRVGSRNEVAGCTGLSHWVEHLLFDGTPTFPKGALHRLVAANGGYRNGFTWNDGTAFFETLPIDRIDLALRLESDRMQHALLDPAEVERERTVIISERQGGENYPTHHLYEEVVASAYKVHPYGQPVIGWKSDLERITRDDLYQHYQRYYHPNNAIAVAVGDFQAEEMLERIGGHFGGIAAGEPAAPLRSVEPVQEGERRIEVRRPGGTGHLLAVYHIPAASHPDLAALSIADAVLSGGKALGRGGGGMGRSSRLRRALVDTGKCSSTSAGTGVNVDPSLFTLFATLRPGTDPEEVERIAFAEVKRLADELVGDAELSSAIEQTAAQLVYAAEGVSRQASALGRGLLVGLPLDDAEILARLRAVTAGDVQRVAEVYLRQDNRTTGWFHPATEARAQAPTPVAAPERPVAAPAAVISRQPRKGFVVHRDVLPNGIVVLRHQSPGAPWAVVQVALPGGHAYDPDDRRGLSALQSSLRLRGTDSRTYEQLSEETDRLGMQLGGGAGDYHSSYGLKCLLEHVDTGLTLLAEVLMHPVYPASQMEAVRAPLLAQAREQATNTQTVAARRFRELAYPPSHPYHRWTLGDEEEIRAFSRDGVIEMAERFRGSAGAVVVVAGGLDPDDVLQRIERALGGWQPAGPAPVIDVPPVETMPEQKRDARFVPGKTQTDLVIGLPGIARNNPDYHPFLLGDTVLGRLGMGGRVGEEIRERRGLAYYAGTGFQAGYGPGPWTARIGVAPKDVDAAVAATIEEFHRYRDEGPTEQELTDAKQLVNGNRALSMETTDGVAGMLMAIEQFGLGLDYVDRVPGEIDAVTAEQVVRAVRTHLDLVRLVVVSAGPESREAANVGGP